MVHITTIQIPVSSNYFYRPLHDLLHFLAQTCFFRFLSVHDFPLIHLFSSPDLYSVLQSLTFFLSPLFGTMLSPFRTPYPVLSSGLVFPHFPKPAGAASTSSSKQGFLMSIPRLRSKFHVYFGEIRYFNTYSSILWLLILLSVSLILRWTTWG